MKTIAHTIGEEVEFYTFVDSSPKTPKSLILQKREAKRMYSDAYVQVTSCSSY